MKLSSETLEIINSIKTINAGSPIQGAVFKKGSEIKARKYKAFAPIIYADIEEKFPRDFAIHDLHKFIAMFSLFEDPDIIFEDDYLMFKSGRRRAKIRYAPAHLIEKPDFFEKRIQMPPVMASVDMTKEIFKTINTAAARMSAPEIAFISNGETVTLCTYNSKDENADRFEIDLGESERSFKIIVDLDNVKFLDRDYKVSLTEKGLLEWQSGKLTYYITASDKSRVN